jgi:hypothetical protein
MQFIDAQKNLCTKLNLTFTDVSANTNALFSLQEIKDAILFGLVRAVERKPWPFLESTVALTANVSADTYSATGLVPESATFISVAGTAWTGEGKGKRVFADYMQWRTDYPTDTSQIWSEYGGQFYINRAALTNGQAILVYGSKMLALPSADSDTLPFTLLNNLTYATGDEAIIMLGHSRLLASEKKKDEPQSTAEEKKAYALLDGLWTTLSDSKAKKVSQNRPFFNVDNFFPGRSNRGNTNIANFP